MLQIFKFKMTNSHKYSFFGQNTGLIFLSNSKYNPFIYIQCIKRKLGDNWEKPSNGEGKVIISTVRSNSIKIYKNL